MLVAVDRFASVEDCLQAAFSILGDNVPGVPVTSRTEHLDDPRPSAGPWEDMTSPERHVQAAWVSRHVAELLPVGLRIMVEARFTAPRPGEQEARKRGAVGLLALHIERTMTRPAPLAFIEDAVRMWVGIRPTKTNEEWCAILHRSRSTVQDWRRRVVDRLEDMRARAGNILHDAFVGAGWVEGG